MSRPSSAAVEPAPDPPAPSAQGRTAAARRLGHLLSTVWQDRRYAWTLGLGAGAAYGLLAAVWTPRGPLTPAEGVSAMVLGLVTGVAAGFLVRSRWAMLLAPLAFVAAVELARMDLTGPTVDLPRPGTTYGLLAIAVGRGVHGLLALAPMVLGAAFGAALARPGTRPGTAHLGVLWTGWLWLRRGVAGGAALALVVLAVVVARPASTAPYLDEDGRPVAGSVAELTSVDVGDRRLSLMLRGRDAANPVLLFLAGGPGGSELGAMRRHGQALEEDFVVATLDQPGAGRSYDALDPVAGLTPERAVRDVHEVTEALRERFDEEAVYLVGQSWGSLLGVLAVQQRPDLFHAFVGVGQMVSPRATDQVFFQDTLAWARRTGRAAVVEALVRSGPPPYADLVDYEQVLAHEQEVYPYDHTANAEGEGQMTENLGVEEYSLLERVHVLAGFLDTFGALYPQVQDIDLRHDATTLRVPVHLAQGAHEAPGRAGPAREWFTMLDAPSKRWVRFATSGHRPLWEQPERFHALMREVLAGTLGAEPAATR